jgi:hypothetical protein
LRNSSRFVSKRKPGFYQKNHGSGAYPCGGGSCGFLRCIRKDYHFQGK